MSAGIAIVVPIQRVIETLENSPVLIAQRNEYFRKKSEASGPSRNGVVAAPEVQEPHHGQDPAGHE
jgi:hypothetical protein